MTPDHEPPRRPAEAVPSGLWPGSSPELIAAHERTLALVASEPRTVHPAGAGLALGRAGWFALALVVTCLTVGLARDAWPGIHFEDDSLERRKYEHFARTADQYDAVFVGSSQVYRHVDATRFDQALEAAGVSLHSFNFGLPGMYMPEVLHTVDWILAREPARLKWLFVELRELQPETVPEYELTRREVQWHDLRTTALMARLIWSSEASLWQRLARLRRTLRHACYRLGNVSLAYPLFREWTGRRPEFRAEWSREGFLPIDVEARRNPDDLSLQRRRQRFRAQQDVFLRYAEAYRTDPVDREPGPLLRDTLAELTARIRAAGVEPVYFLGVPSWSRYAELKRAQEQGVIPTLFAYNDPDRYPEFYVRDRLFDERHLDTSGAERFTDLLARDFLEVLQATPGAGR